MSDTLYAYMAGILDGEGSIMIRKSTYRIINPKYNDCKNPQYTARIAIKMTDEKPLKLFKDLFGGNLRKETKVYQSKNSFKTGKLLYVYGAEHKLAENILNALLPYLLVKKKQAEVALQISKLKKQFNKRDSNGKFYGQKYSQELIDKLAEKWMEVKILNGSRFI